MGQGVIRDVLLVTRDDKGRVTSTGLPDGVSAGFLPTVVAQSGTAVSHTGDTNAYNYAVVTIPGGLMHAQGKLQVVSHWTHTNSANNKTKTITFGAMTIQSTVVTTAATSRDYVEVNNRTTATQYAYPAVGFGTSTSAMLTGAVATTQDVTLTITGQLASAGETLTLEGYTVTCIPA